MDYFTIKDRFYYKEGKLFNKRRLNSRAAKDDEAGTDLKVREFCYRSIRINNKRFLTHRVIWVMFNKDIPYKMEIDHINGDTKDNRIENLRCVEPHINRRNMRKYNTNTSGICGVSWDKVNNKWYATASDIKGIKKNLGRYENKNEAEKVVVKFRRSQEYTERHGD